MQNQFKPQMEATVEAAYELANLSFSQVERLTQLALEQSKVNAELLQDQIQLERRPLSAVIGDDVQPVYKRKMQPERDRKNAERIAVKNLRSMDEIK